MKQCSLFRAKFGVSTTEVLHDDRTIRSCTSRTTVLLPCDMKTGDETLAGDELTSARVESRRYQTDSATIVAPPFGAQSLQLLPSAISPLPECAVFVRPPYDAPCLQLPVTPGLDEVVALGPDELVDFVVSMPHGEALSANVNTNTSLSSLVHLYFLVSI
jgi:hypothetical protein